MVKIYKKLNWFFKEYKKEYIIGLLALLILNINVILIPFFIGKTADLITKKSYTLNSLLILLAIQLANIIIAYITQYIWSYYIFKAADTIRYRLREKIINKILSTDTYFFEKNSVGDLMANATNDVNAIGRFAGFGILCAFDSTAFPITIIFAMAYYASVKLTIVAVLPLLLISIFVKRLKKKIEVYSKKSQKAFGDLNDKMIENVSGVRLIRAYNKYDSEREAFTNKANFFKESNYTLAKLKLLFYPSIDGVEILSMTLVILVGALMTMSSQITIGAFISFIMYQKMLVWPMIAIGQYVSASTEALSAAERIDNMLNYREIVDDREDKDVAQNGDIEFRNFSFKYDNTNVLSNINLKVKKGETLGIVGKVGSGKSTLVKQLLCFYKTNPNSIFINNRPFEDFSLKSIKSLMGYTPQQNIIFSKTIRDNILLDETSDINSLIDTASLKKDIDSFTNGLDTLTGERGISLSGGQKQRIAIARSLAKDPKILIMDDSLSALDAKTEEEIIENIKKHRVGKTNIIVSHRISAVMHADNIIVLDNGKIVEEGTHEKLVSENGWYKDQYEHQKLGGVYE